MTKLTLDQVITKLPSDSKLTPLFFLESKNGSRYLQCKCTCGKVTEVIMDNLIRGVTKSCGCLVGWVKSKGRKYIGVNIDIRAIWGAMMQRCYNKTCKAYKRYGGRGVTVCKEWHNYQNFLDWCLNNGWIKGLHIDKDIKGNGLLYSPSTCKFVSRIENANNTRTNKYVEYKGEKITLANACRLAKVNYNMIYRRMVNRGYTFEEAISIPIDIKKITWKSKGIIQKP